MRRSLPLLIAGLPILLAAQGTPRVATAVLNHVTVLDPAGSARRDMAVVIRGSRIAAVDRACAIEIPSGAQVLDLTGKFVLPGLIDMHNHVGRGAAMPGPPAPGQEPSRDARAEAVRAATVNPAKALGREKDLGTVERDKLADLLVLDADPLVDIQNIRRIHRVIKGGIVYQPAQLVTTIR